GPPRVGGSAAGTLGEPHRTGLAARVRTWCAELVARLQRAQRSLPLQRRVAYLTMIAVALAVAGTSVAGYVTLRYSLYRALDQEMVETASSLAVPTAQDIRTVNGLTERALRAG